MLHLLSVCLSLQLYRIEQYEECHSLYRDVIKNSQVSITRDRYTISYLFYDVFIHDVLFRMALVAVLLHFMWLLVLPVSWLLFLFWATWSAFCYLFFSLSPPFLLFLKFLSNILHKLLKFCFLMTCQNFHHLILIVLASFFFCSPDGELLHYICNTHMYSVCNIELNLTKRNLK